MSSREVAIYKDWQAAGEVAREYNDGHLREKSAGGT